MQYRSLLTIGKMDTKNNLTKRSISAILCLLLKIYPESTPLWGQLLETGLLQKNIDQTARLDKIFFKLRHGV